MTDAEGIEPRDGLHFSARTVAEGELITSLGWMIHLRWLAGLAVVLATLVAKRALSIPLPDTLYVVGLSILGYNLALSFVCPWMARRPVPSLSGYEWCARWQIGLDWLAMAALLHLSGGIESPALPFFLFHITIASLLLPHAHGFLYVSLAPALVAGIAVLELTGILPHVTLVHPPRYRDPLFVAGAIVFFTAACYVMGYFCMSIARRLRRREDELSGLYESVRDTTSTLDLQTVLNRFVESAARILRCKAAAIRLVDVKGQMDFAASWGLSDQYLARVPIEAEHSKLDQDTLAGKAVFVNEVATDPRIWQVERVLAEGVGSMLSVPLLGGRGPIGVLRAYGANGHRFTEEDAQYLAAVAAHGVVAIQNAQAYHLLADLDRRKSRFVRTATHELRSPVVVAESLLTALGKEYAGSLTAQQADMVARAVRRLDALKALIDDLLDLAAGKADLRGGRARPVTLKPAVAEVCDRLMPRVREKGLTLALEAPDDAIVLLIDPHDLDRIVGNLLSNAIKYTKAGSVRVSLSEERDEALVAVADTGIGIPAASIAHLFEEFYRAPNARLAEDTGTGLGLAIVKDLVEAYRGRIQVESREGEGTRVTIRLPLAAAPSAARA